MTRTLSARSFVRTSFGALTMTLFPVLLSLCFSLSAAAIEVRVIDPLTPVYDAESAREAASGDELLLAAPRNGSASAQVVIIGEGAAGLRVEMGVLSDGEAELPVEGVEIRYAWVEEDYSPDDTVSRLGDVAGRAYYDRLLPEPQPGAELVPVWLSVRVPAYAEAGTYTGELAVGEEIVPVRLSVSPWLCPHPSEYAAHVGVIPSLLAVARHYEVEHWSEEHWNLVEQQLKFMGAIGADDLWLYVDPTTGNRRDIPAIHFTRDDAGRLTADFSVTERYMDLFAEHVGRPSKVIVYVWDSGHRRDRRRPFRGVVDGAVEVIPSPEEPGGDRFWGMTIAGLARLMQERDWPIESIIIGSGHDTRPDPDTVEAWRRIAPFGSWLLWTHGRGDRPLNEFEADEPIIQAGLEVGYYAHPYAPRPGGTPYFMGGWNLNHPIYSSGRNFLARYMPPSQWRNWPGGQLLGHPGGGGGRGLQVSGGFAFFFMDHWGVSRHHIQSNMIRANARSFIEPGPDGPVPTVRFEMLREGLQETEARVQVERALAEGRLDGALEEEAKELLTTLFNIRYWHDREGRFSTIWGVAEYPRWIDLTSQLYDMAARVSVAVE